MLFAARRKAVVTSALAFFGEIPGGSDQATGFEAVEGGIERAGFDLEELFGSALDMSGDGVTVRRAVDEGAENQDVERALEEVDARGWVVLPLPSKGEFYSRLSGRQ